MQPAFCAAFEADANLPSSPVLPGIWLVFILQQDGGTSDIR